nr:hypothetical protein [Tanacetum cinerariifolium]
MPDPELPQDHLSTPPSQQTSDPNAPVFKHGQSSDPNTASFSRSHETDAGPFTNVDDEPLDGSFHMSPPRSGKVGQEGQIIRSETQDQELEDGTVTVDSNIPPGGASNTPADSTSVPAAVVTGASTAAKRLHDEEQAQLDRQRAESCNDVDNKKFLLKPCIILRKIGSTSGL